MFNGVKILDLSKNLKFPTIIVFLVFWTESKDLPNYPEKNMLISVDFFAVLLRYFLSSGWNLIIVKTTTE